MQLGGYTEGRQVRVPVWIALVLGLLWGAGVLGDFRSADQYGEDDGEEIYLLYADREMRLLDGVRSVPGWMRWCFEPGVGKEEVVVEELLRTLEEGGELGIVGREGLRIRAVLHWAMGSRKEAEQALGKGWDEASPGGVILRSVIRNEPPEFAGSLDVMREEVSSGRARAWDVWALRFAMREAGAPPGSVFDAYERQCRRLAWRALAAMVIPGLLVLAGIACLPWVLRRWGAAPAPAGHPVIGLWSAPLVLAVFFVTDFVGDLAADALALAFGFIAEWPVWLELAWDTVWRMTPVVLVALFMFNRPAHLGRVFGLNRSGHWPAALAMLAVLWSWDWVVTLFTGGAAVLPVQPQDFILYPDPSAGELGLDFFTSCVTAPLTEEIMFRGLLFMGLRRSIGPWAALAVSSFLFGVIHWQYDVFGVFSVMLLGAGNALLVWRTGSLFPAVMVHAAYNFLVTLMVTTVYQWPL